MKNFCLITLFICFSGLPVWGGGTSEKAVYDLIERVTPGYASQYRLEMIQPENGSDVYEVDGDLLPLSGAVHGAARRRVEHYVPADQNRT